MKKTVTIILSLILVFCAFPISAFADDNYFDKKTIEYYKGLGLQGTTVNVYNWGEYISDGSEDSMNVVKEFEKLTGCKVNYTNYESNENMYSKLIGGGVSYDVIVPSDYMIDKLIDEDMLLELDYKNIPNMKYVDKKFQKLFYDPDQKYSVCYNVGTTILIYNKKLVKEPPKSWDVLWDEQYKGKILMFNNPRDAFAIAQTRLGIDFNSTNEQDWVKAAELLAQQKDKVNPVYVMDEVFNLMESGEYAFATYYAGDYVLMNENNSDLGYCIPEEGVNAFYDAFCIPKCSKNKAGGEAFINFMQEPEVALANSEYIYYRSANYTVEQNKESSLYGNPAVYSNAKKVQYFKNLPQSTNELENRLWTEVKSGQLSTDSKKQDRKIYSQCAVLGATVIVVITIKIINNSKKKKEQDLSDLYD
jgi:spermidine/putrescine transport system substrate-binding protein